MKNSNAIDDSISFIESSLTEAIDIGELAQQAFFSKTHYQRLFRATVGEPVMEYVTNRRLQLACRDVRAGSNGILDIALKYGYDSHEGFTRAFKAYFGVTPSEYRKCGIPNETEVIVMLSNEVLNRIGKNAEKTSAMLSNFIEEAEKLVALANKTAELAGAKGTTTTIVANELSNLTADTNLVRTRNIAEYREAIAKFLQELNKEVSATHLISNQLLALIKRSGYLVMKYPLRGVVFSTIVHWVAFCP